MSEDARGGNYRFFSNTACEYYPCHEMASGELNCLFCFCPLYCLGKDCGGNPRFIDTPEGPVKDCSACTLPHRRENYDLVMSRFGDVCRRMGEFEAARGTSAEHESVAPGDVAEG